MQYHSNGKLMLTGEYLALDGALTLALPTKFGQSLQVEEGEKQDKPVLLWNSITNEGKTWFTAELQIDDLFILTTSDIKTAETLVKILTIAKQLSTSKIFIPQKNYRVSTHLEFPQNWGLGSSSTLLNNIADWFQVDVLTLFFKVFNGSGYDVACARSDSPVLYQKAKNKVVVSPVEFHPDFAEQLFFIHLNQKQNSYNEIKKYQKVTKKDETFQKKVKRISEISDTLTKTSTLDEFENLLREHEEIIAEVLHQKPIQQVNFKDYKGGIIKSLGAWGGDFILATGKKNDMHYFTEKGYKTILNYSDMIL